MTIEIEHLTKTYRVAKKRTGLGASIKGLFHREYEDVHAVKDLGFSIQAGERVGFLGPNGAGKTTTLKMLAGLLTPTSGTVRVLGYDPRRRPKEFLKKITLVMGQKQQLIWDLPPGETIDLNRAVYEIDRADYDRTLAELVAMLEIAPLLEKPTRQLSLGERMKCELAAALIHRPKVLFLDEPTIGLDVTMQATVRRFIKQFNEQTGATVILTSHYMEDVNALCPRVVVIDKGSLLHDGDLEKLVAQTNPDKLIWVHLAKPVERPAVDALVAKGAPIAVVEHDGVKLSVRCAPSKITEAVRALLEGLPVVDLRVEDPPLEDTMRQVFGRGAAEAR